MKSSSFQPTLLLAPEIFSPAGGIARILRLYLKALCERAAARQSSVRLVALNDATVDSTDAARSESFHAEDWLACSGDKGLFIRSALARSRGCDHIVCGHVAQLPVAWAAQKLHRGLRYSLVAHGIEVWREFTWTERLALRGAERILCVSDFTRRKLLEHFPLPLEKLVVIPNVLDPGFAIGPGVPLGACPPVILSVARLDRQDSYKGIDHLIAALPAIRRAIPATTLRVVGRGDDLPRLQSLVRANGLPVAAVQFTGFVDDRTLAAELRACRLFALPSGKEGFGLVLLEAMAHGRPCLGANAGGIPEVITPDTGVLTQYGDVTALAAAAVAALHHRWDESAILARARMFSYSRFKTQLDSLLAERKN